MALTSSVLTRFSQYVSRKISRHSFLSLLVLVLPPALLGALHTFSFAPFHAGWLQCVTLGGLYYLLTTQPRTRTQGFLCGAMFGLAWFLTGTSWIYISLHEYGALPASLAALATLLFCLLLACFPALAALAFTVLRNVPAAVPTWLSALLFAACWVASEWLRGSVFTGFPWIVSGSAHTADWLSGYAPVFGMYGITAIAAALAAWFIEVIVGLMTSNMNARRARVSLAAIIVMTLGLGMALRQMPFTTPYGKPLTVRLLQGNVAQDIKFDPQRSHDIFQHYFSLITQQAADVIVTPETAFPVWWHEIDPSYLQRLQNFSQRTQSHLVLGVPVLDWNPVMPARYTNSALHLAPTAATDPASSSTTRYNKVHLVPFGEFIPWGFRWFVDALHMPLGDFTRGRVGQPSFAIADQRIAINICYEDLFAAEISRHLRGDSPPTLLLNLSNIAWFGDSLAPPQHLQASQMRALETGRPMLRATNTGITALIAANGQVTAQLAPYTTGSLNVTVQGRQGRTPYVLWGDVPVLLFVALVLGGAVLRYRLSKSFRDVGTG